MPKPHDWIRLAGNTTTPANEEGLCCVARCARCDLVQIGIDHQDGHGLTMWHFDRFGNIIGKMMVDAEGCSRGDMTEDEAAERYQEVP